MIWQAHHALFRMIGRLDTWLLRCDLLFLAVIAGLPFPASLLSEYGSTAEATAIYAGSMALAAGVLGAMAVRLLVEPRLRKDGAPRERVLVALQRSTVVVAVFATSIPFTLLSPTVAKYWWLLGVPLLRRLSRDNDTPLGMGRPAR